VQAAYAPHKPVVEGQPNATTFDLILKLSYLIVLKLLSSGRHAYKPNIGRFVVV
jgi:hypothetical protein